RSRRMLMEALARLLMKKEFEDISIQEIADEATLNRATFYLHYPDKNALLQAMTELRFRNLIDRRRITFTDCYGALRAIALGVCDYFAETTGCPSQMARMPLENSIIPVVEGMFKEGLAVHGTAPGVDAALLATTAAWAVFGAARRWFQTPNRIPAEEMATRIETMVSPILFSAAQ
ncbi:MAG TPA: TetR/AcrR family transcriptional regulator, partial [Terriglobales bacterium]|nr:TetR/AcrR family transcriptional regulator [Terriglobales bacterium]